MKMPDCYFLIKAETVMLNRSSQNVLRKHSLFDKTKAIVSKEERVLLISFTTLNKVKRLSKKNATVNLCEDCFDLFGS